MFKKGYEYPIGKKRAENGPFHTVEAIELELGEWFTTIAKQIEGKPLGSP